MLRSILKTTSCAAVLAISVAQAAKVMDSSVNGDTNSGISGAGDSAAKIEHCGMVSAPTLEILSGPVLMKQKPSGRLLVGGVPMAGMSKGRRYMRGLPADAFCSLHFLHGIKIGDLETNASAVLAVTHPASALRVMWKTVKSQGG